MLEIKRLFESPNEVLTAVESGTEVMVFGKLTIAKGQYTLTVGPYAFKAMLASYKDSMSRKRPDMFGDFRFVLSNYYEPELIEKLMEQGIEVDEPDLAAIVENREGRIVWLVRGSKSIGFKHILLRHGEHADLDKKFSTIFGISDDPQTIGNFIFEAITRDLIYKTLPGEGGRSKFYVYRIRIEGETNYLHVLVHEDGSIITAYPSKYSN